jgi:transposase
MNNKLLNELFPLYLSHVETEINEDNIKLYFISDRSECACPKCGKISNKIRTSYSRKLQDLPVVDKILFLDIKLKKYVCNNKFCNKKNFVEPIEDFAAKGARRTKRLNNLLTKIALTDSAEGGSKLCKEHCITISGDTLLRLAKSVEIEIDKINITAVGLDDFALKKNIDMEQLL